MTTELTPSELKGAYPADTTSVLAFLRLTSSVTAGPASHSTMAARHEVALRLQRRLDDLQITTKGYQQIVNQLLYLAVSGLTAWMLWWVPNILTWEAAVAVGVIGGFVAPLVGRVLRYSAI